MLAAAAAASVSREVGLARRSGGGLRPGVSADDLRIVVGPANGGATQTQAVAQSFTTPLDWNRWMLWEEAKPFA